jgi:phage gp16-like protein
MVFSGSDQYAVHKLHNTVAELRRHGFVWQGRGGKHTAERLNRKHSTSAG